MRYFLTETSIYFLKIGQYKTFKNLQLTLTYFFPWFYYFEDFSYRVAFM